MLRALVERARQGDEEAFAALTNAVGDRCMAVAFRILRDVDLAEDAVQVALVTGWRQLRSLRDRIGSRPGSIAFSSAPATSRPDADGSGPFTCSGCRRRAATPPTTS